jgi:hypothetical protein
MNKLNKSKCYLIGHMEFINGRGWREYVKERFSKMGITCIDPYNKPFINARIEDESARTRLKDWMAAGEYDKVTEQMRLIRAEDLRICDLVDFVFAHIHPTIASWGTAEELYWSNRMKKPVFLSVEGGKPATPLWLMGTLPHKYIYNSIDDAIKMVERIDSGEIEIDSARWKLLKPEYR